LIITQFDRKTLTNLIDRSLRRIVVEFHDQFVSHFVVVGHELLLDFLTDAPTEMPQPLVLFQVLVFLFHALLLAPENEQSEKREE
jgi:hypothetical protein